MGAVPVLGGIWEIAFCPAGAARCGQQAVEQRNRGARIDGGALPQRLFSPGLKSRRQFFAHPLRGVGVQAAHSGKLVS